MMELKICHLYPDVLNLYGDRGNLQCMRQRLNWRGVGCQVDNVGIGDTASLSEYDLFFIGGGQDFEQTVLLGDLRAGKDWEIRAAAQDGKPFLCVCGGYQLMGKTYKTADGQLCDFLGVVDMTTEGSRNRLIGNYAFALTDDLGGSTVIGFENHGGRTYLGSGVQPLGTVLKGNGNNGADGTEGVHWKNVFGTYSHGPLLPKNPAFCDALLTCGLVRKYGAAVLEPLPDQLEQATRKSLMERLHF